MCRSPWPADAVDVESGFAERVADAMARPRRRVTSPNARDRPGPVSMKP
ncbi:hypothetical protein ACWC10_22845 [Streptomyces sp. NPDC001595]